LNRLLRQRRGKRLQILENHGSPERKREKTPALAQMAATGHLAKAAKEEATQPQITSRQAATAASRAGTAMEQAYLKISSQGRSAV